MTNSQRLTVRASEIRQRLNEIAELENDADRTLVTVDSRAQVGGTIARVGQRLLGSVSKMMMDRFFACLATKAASSPAD